MSSWILQTRQHRVVFSLGLSDIPIPRVYHYDCIRYVSCEDGEIGQIMKFDPFGNRIDPIDATKPAADSKSPIYIGFTGHEHDDEIGLVNMKGRIYDPKLARFLTADPIVYKPFFGQAFNSYSYVMNSPLNYVDPTGYCPDL